MGVQVNYARRAEHTAAAYIIIIGCFDACLESLCRLVMLFCGWNEQPTSKIVVCICGMLVCLYHQGKNSIEREGDDIFAHTTSQHSLEIPWLSQQENAMRKGEKRGKSARRRRWRRGGEYRRLVDVWHARDLLNQP